MSESDKSFTVSDRRHFTPDGRPRDETAGEAGDAAGDVGATPPDPPAEARPGAPPSGSRPAAAPAGPADFSRFLLGLAAQAGALLAVEKPGEGEGLDPAEALEGARSVVAILEMLKDKTEGRRTPSEEALLDDLLFQLRMAYVERTRAGGA